MNNLVHFPNKSPGLIPPVSNDTFGWGISKAKGHLTLSPTPFGISKKEQGMSNVKRNSIADTWKFGKNNPPLQGQGLKQSCPLLEGSYYYMRTIF
jgi:hypothetical protein